MIATVSGPFRSENTSNKINDIMDVKSFNIEGLKEAKRRRRRRRIMMKSSVFKTIKFPAVCWCVVEP